MTRQEIERKLSEIREELDREGVAALYLFGSAARGDADESSDVDLLVDLREDLDDIAADRKTVEAILWNFTIIGEAAANVPLP